MATHYVDNKTLYARIVEYRQSVLEAKEQDLPRPRIPNYIGECVLMIANRLATKPNFVNYSYKEEMIADGVENCICYIDNFDPLKSSNPFAYFTQIIYYAFLRRILKEKKQQYVKHKCFENNMLFHDIIEQSEFDEKDMVNSVVDLDHNNVFDFIKTFEDNLESKKKKRKKGIENFIEDGVESAIEENVEGIDLPELDIDPEAL